MPRRAYAWRLALLVATCLSLYLSTFKLRLSSDLTDLFPNRGDAGMLTRFLRGFGGGDLAVVLVRGDDPAEVDRAGAALAEALRTKGSVVRVLSSAPPPKGFDPTLAWAYAGPTARDALAEALTPEGMRARLDGTREMLLAPGSSEAAEWLAKDPLRLTTLPWEHRTEIAAGVNVGTGADGAFVGDPGARGWSSPSRAGARSTARTPRRSSRTPARRWTPRARPRRA